MMRYLPSGIVVKGGAEGVAGCWIGESSWVVHDPSLDAGDRLQQTKIAGFRHFVAVVNEDALRTVIRKLVACCG